MSATKDASNHMKILFSSKTSDGWVSLGVFNDSSYDTPEGVMFSFSFNIKDGKWDMAVASSLATFSLAREEKGYAVEILDASEKNATIFT